ncbi:MAG TPA: ABC transporter permease [Thermotogota bacterium]|nr:ABC transporter permease [Thermotogota bacterium]HRW93632.1 ABC transporter permease [Thermotogota bacterium]
MFRYMRRKIIIYLLTFVVAVTLDWIIPRLMPGNPIIGLISRLASMPQQVEELYAHLTKAFGMDQPLWKQYFMFWNALFNGDLGISITVYPKPVLDLIRQALPYDLMLTVPAILLSWIVGNKFGAFAARKKRLDNWVLPVWYVVTATPYLWLGILLSWALGVVLDIFPIAGAYSFSIRPSFSWEFILDYLHHWFLPFLSLFVVQLGGWAIGMRNMIIYELEADYSRYLETMGAPPRLIRRYAFKNALLPQVTGLAVQLGVIVTGALTTEIVFSYPGIGYLLNQAILQEDYFLIQGCFLFVILGVLIANFVIDIVYVFIDPRVRLSMGGDS